MFGTATTSVVVLGLACLCHCVVFGDAVEEVCAACHDAVVVVVGVVE